VLPLGGRAVLIADVREVYLPRRVVDWAEFAKECTETLPGLVPLGEAKTSLAFNRQWFGYSHESASDVVVRPPVRLSASIGRRLGTIRVRQACQRYVFCPSTDELPSYGVWYGHVDP